MIGELVDVHDATNAFARAVETASGSGRGSRRNGRVLFALGATQQCDPLQNRRTDIKVSSKEHQRGTDRYKNVYRRFFMNFKTAASR